MLDRPDYETIFILNTLLNSCGYIGCAAGNPSHIRKTSKENRIIPHNGNHVDRRKDINNNKI